MAGFNIVRVPGIVRVNFRDTYPHYIGPPTVRVKSVDTRLSSPKSYPPPRDLYKSFKAKSWFLEGTSLCRELRDAPNLRNFHPGEVRLFVNFMHENRVDHFFNVFFFSLTSTVAQLK